MSLQELKNQAYKLSVTERLELVSDIINSLSQELRPRKDIQGAIERLRGIAKTDSPPPTDVEVEQMREERLVEKYLK
ncbi:MAG: hypothetical protein DSM107014_11020 [Gomphosphaeria aponina SAG 52.96 = DSM 107014]|uniref:Uncharacterized protein n=1 Tax=Gomphosphaeria aponina SAG 52.96 = DSM 107014 TaxID=1521640 RepID=A0A941GS05_9CHRO|nr:hypothetical protein [Gomphosphaeria aponina SAG 52.96 = DSM 107014]